MSVLDGLRTLVLNADGMPIALTSWKRSICLLFDGKVTQLEFYGSVVARDGKGRAHPVPAVVILNRYIRRDYRRAPFCRKNMLIRDSGRCVYCDSKCSHEQLSMDHVIPRSRWTGATSPTCWENVVTCCVLCNKRKGDKMCEEARMFPRVRPAAPSYGDIFIGLNPYGDATPPEWVPYLSNIPSFEKTVHDEPETTLQQ